MQQVRERERALLLEEAVNNIQPFTEELREFAAAYSVPPDALRKHVLFIRRLFLWIEDESVCARSLRIACLLCFCHRFCGVCCMLACPMCSNVLELDLRLLRLHVTRLSWMLIDRKEVLLRMCSVLTDVAASDEDNDPNADRRRRRRTEASML